jgi:predicted TIM-barrel fold metal-dependent hydrolase
VERSRDCWGFQFAPDLSVVMQMGASRQSVTPTHAPNLRGMSLPTRRDFVHRLLAGSAALGLATGIRGASAAKGDSESASGFTEGFLTDVNVYVGQWPFRRVTGDEPATLIPLLKRNGVKRAWAANLEGLLNRDLGAVNVRLVEICRRETRGLLIPFGAINPTLPDWEEDLRRCHEIHRMPGVRLHPNYHGYKLSDPAFSRLMEIAAKRGLMVQIATQMEDRRTQHALANVAPVDVSPLADLAARFPLVPFVVLNASLSTPLATRLAGVGRIFFDLSHQEGLQGISRALQSVPVARVLFGSHAPLFLPEANLLKLRESPLTEEQLQAIAFANAELLVRG